MKNSSRDSCGLVVEGTSSLVARVARVDWCEWYDSTLPHQVLAEAYGDALARILGSGVESRFTK